MSSPALELQMVIHIWNSETTFRRQIMNITIYHLLQKLLPHWGLYCMDSPTSSSLLTAAARVKYCVERDRLSMVTIQPTYHITKVNFMHTLKQCSAITECLHGYTDLQLSVRYLTPTRCISYQCCSFRKKKKTFINSSRLGGYSQPRLFQVHTVVVW